MQDTRLWLITRHSASVSSLGICQGNKSCPCLAIAIQRSSATRKVASCQPAVKKGSVEAYFGTLKPPATRSFVRTPVEDLRSYRDIVRVELELRYDIHATSRPRTRARVARSIERMAESGVVKMKRVVDISSPALASSFFTPNERQNFHR